MVKLALVKEQLNHENNIEMERNDAITDTNENE